MRRYAQRRMVLALVLPACTPLEPAATTHAKPVPDVPVAGAPPVAVEPTPPVEPVADAPPVELPADLKITLERTRCYGSCPIYVVTLDARGEIVWNGRKHVAHAGHTRAKLESLDGLRALFGRLEAVDYAAITPSGDPERDAKLCPSMWSDHPSAVVTIVANGTEHVVDDYQGCEGYPPLEAFRALEREIDEVAGTAAWIRPEPQPKDTP